MTEPATDAAFAEAERLWEKWVDGTCDDAEEAQHKIAEHLPAILARLRQAEAALEGARHLRDILMSAPKAGEPDVTGDHYAIHPNQMGSGMDAVREMLRVLGEYRTAQGERDG